LPPRFAAYIASSASLIMSSTEEGGARKVTAPMLTPAVAPLDESVFALWTASERVGLSRRVRDRSHESFEQGVSPCVPLVVVDALEVVDVEVREREEAAVAAHTGQLGLRGAVEGTRVGDAGELVGSRQTVRVRQ
jgi:hypothetical protein